MEKSRFDEVKLDLGQMRIYATLSYFTILIQAMQHAVTIHVILGWQGMFEIAQVFCIYVCVQVCMCRGVSGFWACACTVHVCNENQMVGRVSAWFRSPISNQTAPRSMVWVQTRGLQLWAAT